MIRRFSTWLDNSGVKHELVQVKGGYILRFIDPDEELKKLVGSLFIMIDSTEEDTDHRAIKKPVNIFTAGGEGIVIEYKYAGEILTTVQPVLYSYISDKHNLNN